MQEPRLWGKFCTPSPTKPLFCLKIGRDQDRLVNIESVQIDLITSQIAFFLYKHNA